VVLESAQAIAIGLAVNVLATNALKYGALATQKGRLDVSWRVDRNYLIIDWREADGPEVRAAALESFGSRLLRRLIEGQLKGSVTRQLERSGVVCEIEFPLGTFPAQPAPARPGSSDDERAQSRAASTAAPK
jgi:two-component sensor histidine kinase